MKLLDYEREDLNRELERLFRNSLETYEDIDGTVTGYEYVRPDGWSFDRFVERTATIIEEARRREAKTQAAQSMPTSTVKT